MTIAQIRAHLGMTRADFANAVGVSQPTVSRWEAGLMFPSYHVAKRIAALVDGVSVDDLVRAA
jgi:DNA-binding XRE family transcriptional regulator